MRVILKNIKYCKALKRGGMTLKYMHERDFGFESKKAT